MAKFNLAALFEDGVFKIFEKELETAAVGKKILHDHAVVTEVTDHSVSVEIDISDGFKYSMVVTRLNQDGTVAIPVHAPEQ